ncbi:MAG: TauD/TfdA family dioxygenase [Novosphingobium sp.]|nr:TauD/TfdA family dioxygenase [Novosphingobium sp.]
MATRTLLLERLTTNTGAVIGGIDLREPLGAGFAAKYDPLHAREQVHPVALVHPETGHKAVYVSESFTTRIAELSRAESAAVLATLFRQVEKPDFCVRWRWRAGDIACWDNRGAQHYAVPDYQHGRITQRIVLQGGRPGEMPPR